MTCLGVSGRVFCFCPAGLEMPIDAYVPINRPCRFGRFYIELFFGDAVALRHLGPRFGDHSTSIAT
jgi:hypothetical protein